MTTQARILANRLNAHKSTGPKTPQGKAVVSQNALKHGLAARHDVITAESQADFDLHRDALLAELDPQGPMESILADRIVSLSWRLKRADLIQNQTFDAMNEKNTNNPLANLAKSFGLKGLTIPQNEPTNSNPDLTLGRIALKDFSNERVLDRLLMYERRIEHSLYKTTLELQRLHLLRDLEPSEPNLEPVRATTWGRPDPPQGRPDQPEPEDCRLAPGPVPGGHHRTKQHPRTGPKPSNINHPASSIEYQESSIIAQNKPNSPKPKNNPNPCNRKELQTKTTPAPAKKTNPIKPNLSRQSLRRTRTCRGETFGEAGTNPIKPIRTRSHGAAFGETYSSRAILSLM